MRERVNAGGRLVGLVLMRDQVNAGEVGVLMCDRVNAAGRLVGWD